MYTHVHTHTYIHTYVRALLSAMHVCMSECAPVSVCMCGSVCMSGIQVCTNVCACIHDTLSASSPHVACAYCTSTSGACCIIRSIAYRHMYVHTYIHTYIHQEEWTNSKTQHNNLWQEKNNIYTRNLICINAVILLWLRVWGKLTALLYWNPFPQPLVYSTCACMHVSRYTTCI